MVYPEEFEGACAEHLNLSGVEQRSGARETCWIKVSKVEAMSLNERTARGIECRRSTPAILEQGRAPKQELSARAVQVESPIDDGKRVGKRRQA
eukprot:10353614-Lingulodinium_polyedra.AAC.1